MNRVLVAKLCIARKFVLAFAVPASRCNVCLAGTDITLADVDFNRPPHFVGTRPAFAAGPVTLSIHQSSAESKEAI
jgi:hypothetical protein